ncbi:MAG: hypothetical protein A2Z20_09225 [Bdellovibrionales bacterium RBG_16_40_8]|nr:MAG: hypothetical protein A2Z20_09225 [Bdellovibrionales bacterium RBG_16_40_8]
MFLMAPELILIFTAFSVLILDFIFLKIDKKILFYLALIGIAISTASLFSVWGEEASWLGGRFAIDQVSSWFKFIFLLSTFLTLTFSSISFESKNMPLTHRSEFIFVLLMSLAGMMFLISSRDMVSLYIGLELATIPLFALTAWRRSEKSGEAGIKYLAIGALGSAFLLYGMGLLYGLTAQVDLNLIAKAITANSATWLAAGLIIAGVGFKLTLFPFHMWAPDAYEGAPPIVTAYLSVASKAAGLALAFQFFYRVFWGQLHSWSLLIAIFATATMTLGNFAAITQKNLMRFMAYSAISQAGYLIIGFMGTGAADAQAMIFYLLVYAVTNLAVFAVLILHIQETGNEDMTGLKGFSRVNPLLAFAMMLALFGLAGIPPLAGFVGKFFLFGIAAKYGFYWLVVVAALNSTVSLYYYLRVVRQMYIEDPNPSAKPLQIKPLFALGLFIAIVSCVVLGLIPNVYEGIGKSAQSWIQLFSHLKNI